MILIHCQVRSMQLWFMETKKNVSINTNSVLYALELFSRFLIIHHYSVADRRCIFSRSSCLHIIFTLCWLISHFNHELISAHKSSSFHFFQAHSPIEINFLCTMHVSESFSVEQKRQHHIKIYESWDMRKSKSSNMTARAIVRAQYTIFTRIRSIFEFHSYYFPIFFYLINTFWHLFSYTISTFVDIFVLFFSWAINLQYSNSHCHFRCFIKFEHLC